MTAAGPNRYFGPPPAGRIVHHALPEVNSKHAVFFSNYLVALKGEEEFLVKSSEVRRFLCLMDAVRESARIGNTVMFE